MLSTKLTAGGYRVANGSDHNKRVRLKAAPCVAAILVVLAGGIAACARQQAPAMAQASAAPSTVPAPGPRLVPAPDRTPEEAHHASSVEDRREVILIQQRLQAGEAARRAERAKVPGVGGVRCVNGQRMQRLPNGWKQDGTC
jgi:hypothetical protein